MAREGTRFRQFCSASSVCSPARAALLTGRYPVRTGVSRVLFPGDPGISDTETTIPQMLRGAGYKSMCVGKWHVGSRAPFLPTNKGFDEFFGLPYSHDMWPRPMMHNTDVIEETARLDTLTQRFTEQAVSFIRRSSETPFFLYLAHTAPHIPLEPERRYRGRSPLGRYGDVMEEMDAGVGDVLNAVKDGGLDDNTLILFMSDNGPWYQGSNGVLRGRKGETWEGGVRVPLIARMPGSIPAGRVAPGFASALDILPTLARVGGAPLPGQPLDGVDIWPILCGEQDAVPHDLFLYFDWFHLQCARMGRWKLHVSRYDVPAWTAGNRTNLPLPQPELYDLEAGPEESYDSAGDFPEVVADIRLRIANKLLTLPPAVTSAWRDTMARKVEDTPAGALPVELKP